MSQSSIILGAVLFGFFVYVTVRGQLPTFVAIVTGSAAAASGTGAVASTTALTGAGSIAAGSAGATSGTVSA